MFIKLPGQSILLNPEHVTALSEVEINVTQVDTCDGESYYVNVSRDAMLELLEGKRYEIFKDGDQWCATYSDFENLQESPAAFADTPELALKELINVCQNLVWQ